MGEIRIPAAAARAMTGYCEHHQCALSLVPYADEGLGSVLDAWQCPRYGQDPGPAQQAVDKLTASPRWAPQGNPARRSPETAAEFDRLQRLLEPVRRRCPDSWVLAVPGP